MALLLKFRRTARILYSKHLLATNVVTCGGLLGVGDFMVQKISTFYDTESTRYDYARTGRMIAVGFALGPFNHYWYMFLDRLVKGYGMKTVGKKIICDQMVAGPFFCTMFLYGTTLLEGKGFSGAMAEWRAKFITIYMIDWAFWPAAQLINFRFLPTRFRVLYVSFATLVWNSFLSFIKHKKTHEEIAPSQKTLVRAELNTQS